MMVMFFVEVVDCGVDGCGFVEEVVFLMVVLC